MSIVVLAAGKMLERASTMLQNMALNSSLMAGTDIFGDLCTHS